jgi:hypothetical protein
MWGGGIGVSGMMTQVYELLVYGSSKKGRKYE